VLRGRRATRYGALTAVVAAVGAMVLLAHTDACAAAGVPAQSGGALAAGTRFYLDPHSAVGYWVAHNPDNPLEPAIAHRIADVPTAIWFTSYDPGQIAAQASTITTQAAAEGAVPVLVLYDIPEVNCSAGAGAPSIAAYESWASAFASGLGGHQVIVIVEPDALAGQTCLNAQQAAARDGAIGYAGSAVRRADPNARVYFDAGNSAWNPPQVQAQRLSEAGVATNADGVFSNVSNFQSTADEVNYDEEILGYLGDPAGVHIVVDTSRNGNGPDGTWCDPTGRAIGQTPTADTGDPLVDAYLWIKDPGQADGCADPAGVFDPQIAYNLVADGAGGAGIYTAKTPSPGQIEGQGGAGQSAPALQGSATLRPQVVVTAQTKPYAGCDG
jgi:endoglucanase